MKKTDLENILKQFKYECIGSYNREGNITNLFYKYGNIIYLNRNEEAVILGHLPYSLVNIINRTFGTVRATHCICDEEEWDNKRVQLYKEVQNFKVDDYCGPKDNIPVKCYHILYKNHLESFLRTLDNYYKSNGQTHHKYYNSLSELQDDLNIINNYYKNKKDPNMTSATAKSLLLLDSSLYEAIFGAIEETCYDHILESGNNSTLISSINLLSQKLKLLNQKISEIKPTQFHTYFKDLMKYQLSILQKAINPFEDNNIELKNLENITDMIDISINYDKSNMSSTINWIDLKITNKETGAYSKIQNSYKGFLYEFASPFKNDRVFLAKYQKTNRDDKETLSIYHYDAQQNHRIKIFECNINKMTYKENGKKTCQIKSWESFETLTNYIGEIGSLAYEEILSTLIDPMTYLKYNQDDYV